MKLNRRTETSMALSIAEDMASARLSAAMLAPLFCLLVAFFCLTYVPAAMAGPQAATPDLSGVYDTGTLTPLNRPQAFGDKQFMTREEADRLAKAALDRFEWTDKKSDPNRGAPKKGGDGNNTAGAGGVGGYNSFWIDR